MIRVWYSNRLEHLAERLMERIGPGADGDPAADLFARPPILVPSPQMAAYLKYAVARGTGISAGLNVYEVGSFLESLLSPSRPPWRLVDQAVLRSFYLEVLSGNEPADRPLPEPVRAYLDAAGDDLVARDLRRFQLAARQARLTGQYGDAAAPTEDWQQALWHRILAPDGPLARTEAAGACRWVLPTALYDLLQDDPRYQPPSTLHMFGFSQEWKGLRPLLDHLNSRSDVWIYAVSPRDWRRARDTAGPGLNAFRLWARPGAELARLLAERDGARFRHVFVPADSDSALARLQNEVLDQREPGAFRADGSLVVLPCSGIRREAEVIAGEIWRLIREDDDGSSDRPDRLRFGDIAVLIADTKNLAAYQAHLRAVFEELHGIPHNLIGLGLAGECQAIAAVQLLLALPLGEFSRPELLPLLTHPAVRARFPGADVNRWSTWCDQLEIVHGADRLDHQGTYIDRDLFHWEQGLRRLVLGTFLTGPRCGDDRGFTLDGFDLLPHDEPVEAQGDAARLLLLVRSLVADARFAREARLTLTEWSAFLTRMITAYLAADDDVEQRALAECLSAALELRRLDVGGGPVGYRVACECLRELIGELTATRGHFLVDGVTVAPLAEMRALPFRVAFVCGLGEGLFPSSEGSDPLELARGDVSPRERDQFLFLETLAGTRERLYLSYVARDAQTGNELEPSPVVLELLRHLGRGQSVDAQARWKRPQPLRRYDRPEHADWPLPVLSPAARREARAKQLRDEFVRHCGTAPRMTSELAWNLHPSLRGWLRLGSEQDPSGRNRAERRLAVSLRDLRRFLECPMQGWARLMLRLREDEDDTSVRQDEPFATTRLVETQLLRGVFLDALAAPSAADDPTALAALYEPRADALARTGVMPVGLFRAADRRRHLDCLSAWIAAARKRGILDRGPYHVRRFGRAAENERVDVLGPSIPLDVPITRPDGASETLRVELFGRTELVSAKLPGSLTCVSRPEPKDKDFLAGFLDAVALSLVDHHDPAEYHVHVLTDSLGGKPGTRERTLCGIDETQARQYLVDLLADLLAAPHAYLLPCEAVFDHLVKGVSLTETIEDLRDDPRAPCSSRYGPVPNFAQYDPPDPAEAVRLVKRRFGLFQECGGTRS